jgi:outer membrane protein TolC
VNEGIYTLNVGFPIYDGGTARARVQQQQAAIALAETSRRQAVDQVQLDVQQAYLALVQARQRVAVANVEVSQARESFRVSRVRYQAGVSQQVGVSPQLELSNAQISLTQAESNQVNALYDYNSARAQLDRAVGRYAFAGFGPGYEKPPSLPK